ncbi:hypothetical protein M426DRAFT_7685 [Hypoxylon sp. CI-4A]|nr:hypothetical protein M426DRAFT_7685 [Hypoxylon sp. CI-4A]
MDCKVCHGLDRARLHGSPHAAQNARHDFWVLHKSLHNIISASDTGCDVCYTLSSGLLDYLPGLDPKDVRVEIRIPRQRHQRIRLIANRNSRHQSGAQALADVECYANHHGPANKESDIIPWSEYGRGEEVTSQAGLAFYRSRIQEWIDQCSENHSRCNSVLGSLPQDRLPTRVIDLGVSEDEVQVIESKELQDKYVAFSHCWGGGNLPTTTKHELPQVYSVRTLPASFQDIIFLCRALDIQYLWIDSLCIVQDDKDDWNIESSRMLPYYSGAFLVIAASRSREPSQGFLQPRVQSSVVSPRSQGDPGVVFRKYSPHLASDQDFNLSAPLDCRAWALQERLGARRIVHFYDHEMIWECESTTQCECGKLTSQSPWLEDDTLPLKTRRSDTSTTSISKSSYFCEWTTLIEHYTHCLLSKETDRLPAISGIARYFSHSGLGEYRAGLWEEIMLPCLLWRVNYTLAGRVSADDNTPSWSWASVTGHVNWDFTSKYYLNFIAHILECWTDPYGPDPFGRVKSGRLIMRARTWEAQLEYQPVTGFMALACGESAYFDTNTEMATNTFFQYQDIKCVLVAEGSSAPGQRASTLLALVVRQSYDIDGPLQYRRIGLATLDPGRLADFDEEIMVIV